MSGMKKYTTFKYLKSLDNKLYTVSYVPTVRKGQKEKNKLYSMNKSKVYFICSF